MDVKSSGASDKFRVLLQIVLVSLFTLCMIYWIECMVSDGVMSQKLRVEGVMLKVVSGLTPQGGCDLKKKGTFWRK